MTTHVSRRRYWTGWGLVLTFDALALLAILLIGTYGVLHTESGFYDEVPGGSIEQRLVDLWSLWGLVPGFVLTFAASLASFEFKPEPREGD